MPVKNTAVFLPQCLESILKQSYPHWELLVVNDHSQDNSLSILQDYAQKDARICVLNNSSKGIITALRLAYAQTKGSLITRMDSDDIMPPDKIKHLSHALNQHGKGHVATGLVQYFSDQDLGEGYQRYAAWLNQLTLTGTNFSELYKECVIPSPCWMVHRSDLDACLAFQPNCYPEDYDLCFRFYEQGLTCLSIPHILHYWRDSQGRTSRHDPHYANNSFLELKVHYFLKINYDSKRPLVLWGAGKKGKQLAQLLLKKAIPFTWICNNKNKIGKEIYQQKLFPTQQLSRLQQAQVIIAVAQPEAQTMIKQQLAKQGLKSMIDSFFFC